MAVCPGVKMQGERKRANIRQVKGNTLINDHTKGKLIQRFDIINIYNSIISKTVTKQC